MAHSFNLSPTGSLSWNAANTKIHAPTSGTLSISAGTSIYFDTDNSDKMIIASDGKVGIGTASPDTALDVQGKFSLNSPDLITGINTQIAGEFSIQADNQKFSVVGNNATFWKFRHHVSSTENWFLFTYYEHSSGSWSSVNRGYLSSGGTNAEMNTFTGQHMNLMNTSIGTSQDGLIVSATNGIINTNNSISPTINESLPYCVLSNTNNDKKVFGVISTKEDNNTSRKYSAGNFVSVYEKENINEERMFINSVGEGAVWVSNKNGSLELGDFIVSTTIPGYGGKQADGSLHNYTVAKITCDCDFSLTKIAKQKLKTVQTSAGQELVYDSQGNPEYENDLDPDGNIQMVYQYQTRFLQADGTLLVDQTDYETRLSNGEAVYIACFVGCTYHCG